MYQVEYRLGLRSPWCKAGSEITEAQLLQDYLCKKDVYKDGMRRAYKVTRTYVEFETVIQIKETK